MVQNIGINQATGPALLRSIFFQAGWTETVVVLLGDPDEILLQDLVAFTPAILFPQTLEGASAFGTLFICAGYLHPSGLRLR